MAPALLLRLRALVASCFRSAPAPAPKEDHSINTEIESASALEDDDILREILIRALTPLPSSILRTSLVCKRWCRLLSDPDFLRRFRKHLSTTPPPLLGCFNIDQAVFTPLLCPPNRIPSDRFSLPLPRRHKPLTVKGVRHGLVLLLNSFSSRAFDITVWEPVTGHLHNVPTLLESTASKWNSCNSGDVLRSYAADGDGGGFMVVLILTREEMNGHRDMRVSMAIYESATGKWSETNSTVAPTCFLSYVPAVLVANALCGFFYWTTGILELDLDTNTVGMIQKPKSIDAHESSFFRVVRTQDGGLGLAKLSATIIQLWGRRTHGDPADAEWVLQKTVDLLDKLVFPTRPAATTSVRELPYPRIVGYDEDNNVIHVVVNAGCVFTVNIETLHYTEVFDGHRIHWCEDVTSSFACQNEEISSWCDFFSMCKEPSFICFKVA